jgi:hypothetical protein
VQVQGGGRARNPARDGRKHAAGRPNHEFLEGDFHRHPPFRRHGPETAGPARVRHHLRSHFPENSVDIEVRPASFRTIRGITAVASICEEISTWQRDESLNPDFEILAAVRPALATTGGPLFCIGSPRAKRGETWKTYRRHFGPAGNPAILVANGSTFNPTLKQSVIDRAYEDDPQVAASEWGGKFRDDLESYISPEKVDECTDVNCTVRPYRPGFQYFSHCDPSGGSQDSFCLAVGHVEGDRGVLDCLIEHKPPFSPEVVISDLAGILREYRLAVTVGDRYASGFNSELFARHGITYNYAHMTTSDFYGSFLPIFNSPHRCRLLDNKRLAGQLCSLERRPSRVGAKDSISHPPGAHDDLAAAVARLFVRMIGIRDFTPKKFVPPFVAERERTMSVRDLPSIPSSPENYENPLAPSRPEYQTVADSDWLKAMSWKPPGGW